MKMLILVFFAMILSTASMAKVVLKCQSAESGMPYFEVVVDANLDPVPEPNPPMPTPEPPAPTPEDPIVALDIPMPTPVPPAPTPEEDDNYNNFSIEVRKTTEGHTGPITLVKSFEVTDYLLGEEYSTLKFEDGSLVVVETDDSSKLDALLNVSLYGEVSEVGLICKKY